MEPADGLHRQVGTFHIHTCVCVCVSSVPDGFGLGSCPRGLPTDRPMWSDESGLKECTKGNTAPPSPQWSWVGSLVPAGPPSATSLHFSNNYFTCLSGVRVGCGLQRPGRDGQRGLAVRCGLPRVRPPHPTPLALWVHTPGDAGLNAGPSFVQQHVPRTQNHEGLRQTQEVDKVTGRVGGGGSPSRLCLRAQISNRVMCSAYRKCQIALRAPWQQVPPLRLSDVSLMPCLVQSETEQVPVWAISEKGDVLCRLGASPQNPAVRTSGALGSFTLKRC